MGYVPDAPLEACKTMCELVPTCVSFEHDQDGECNLYSSNDFSATCTAEQDKALYISYKEWMDSDASDYDFKQLQNCFNDTQLIQDTNVTLEVCQSNCLDGNTTSTCYGIQYESSTYTCWYLNGTLPSLEDCSTDTTAAYLVVETDPYQEMDDTCLRNLVDVPEGIMDTDNTQCKALCDAHPFCRYYLYGTDSNGTDPELRECILFEAQAEELDDCSGLNSSYPYYKLTAAVNGRTFVDQITWYVQQQ